jgi:Domain of unknown function (DUF4340)
MNFKTTIVLILCLAIAGIAMYVTRNAPTTEPAPPAAEKLVDISSFDVAKLSIAPAGDKPIVFQKDGIKWLMVEPVNAAADAAAVDDLVSTITGLESHGKSDASGANADVTGLASPTYRLEVTDKSGKTIKLAIGKPTSVGDELYVQKDGESQADRVPSALYASLNKPVSGFRDMKLLDVKAPEIKTLSITSGSGSFSLDRQGNDWHITAGPTTMPADEPAVSDLIFGLSGMRAEEFVTEKADDLKKYGLDDPQLTVTFVTQPTTTQPTTQPLQPGFLKFGRYQDLRKQNVFAMTSASSAIASIPASAMTTFDKKPLDLRDKNVLKLDKNSVETILIETHKPATTQPTTRPASSTVVTIERNKEVPKQPWQGAPFALPKPAATRDAMAQATSGPATVPSTAPTSQASTEPVTPPAKWLITSEPKGPADEPTVDGLLAMLNPLRVEKFLEKSPTTQPADQYRLTIDTTGGSYTINITDPGGSQNPVGELDGLMFEIGRPFLDKLTAKYTPSPTPIGSQMPMP